MKHSEGQIHGHKNLCLYTQSWLPDGPITAIILLAHGYAEHSGRYQNLVDFLVPRGYAIFALDHHGHGKSEGEPVFVERYADYVDDLKTYFDLVRGDHATEKVFLLGHSMGAGISTLYAAQYQHELDGLILSGGGIATAETPPMPVDLDLPAALSHDPAVVEAYRNDPLVFHGAISPERAAIMAEVRERMPAEAAKLTLPILVMAGNDSPLGDGPRSQALFNVVQSADKTLKLYDGLMHEIFNEPEHRAVMADIEQWLAARLR